MRDPVRVKTVRTRMLVLAEQGNRVKVPDTGQASGLICSCKNEARLCAPVQGAYCESGSLKSCNGTERRRAPARCARGFPRLNDQVRRPTHRARRFSSPPYYAYKSSGAFSAAFFFSHLFFFVPPFFLPYLRQLRQVPVMPGGAAEPYFCGKIHSAVSGGVLRRDRARGFRRRSFSVKIGRGDLCKKKRQEYTNCPIASNGGLC